MKKWMVLVIVGSLYAAGISAQADTAPVSERFPTIPPFTLQGIDSSTSITKASLSERKQTLIMYFSPDCDHCQHQTEDMLKNMDQLKDVQIIMATYQPFAEMTAFYEKYQIASYPQIKVGRDTKFFFVPFYKIRELPFMALYDKKGNLIKTFQSTTDMSKITDAFEKTSKKKG